MFGKINFKDNFLTMTEEIIGLPYLQQNVKVTQDETDTSLDDLYVALVQCFAVIICGYVAGRVGIITQRETSGLNTFVSKFSLPALIFVSLCKIDLSTVNWVFVSSVFLAKALIFYFVLIVTLLVTRPTNYARAGLLAIFCTQTNDFAIGVPIVDALYGKSHPEFVTYLYLMAPMSLTILNPSGFLFMELEKYRSTTDRSITYKNKIWQLTGSVISNIIKNPIVFMTALGVFGNYVFEHNPPRLLVSTLDIFGSAFVGTALMLLGLRMVGRVRTLQGEALLVPVLLILVKLLITPIVIREIVGVVMSLYKMPSSELTDYTTFSFLYGTLPTAPGVFVYATAYGFDVDLVASTMVACTFLSAPLMFVSAKMISAATMNIDEYTKHLYAYGNELCKLSALGHVLVLLTFLLCKKYGFPHRVTTLVILSQATACLGSLGMADDGDVFYSFPFVVSVFGDICSFMWIASLAMTLIYIYSGVESFLPRIQPFIISIPITVSVSVLSIMLWTFEMASYDPKIFHTVMNSFTASVLVFSLAATVLSLILCERRRRRNSQYRAFSEDVSGGPSVITPDIISETKGYCDQHPETTSLAGLADEDGEGGHIASDQMVNETDEEDHNKQLLRHFIFLIFSVCSFTVTLALLLWEMISAPVRTGLYLELYFIELTLRRGSGVAAFVLFVLDNKTVIKPTIKRAKKFLYGGEPIELPPLDSLPFETRLLCDKFVRQHLLKCKIEIEKTKWCSLIYGKCFTGAAFAEWLVRNGVVESTEEATIYGNKLLMGGVIQHIFNTEYFYDTPSTLYTFTTPQE